MNSKNKRIVIGILIAFVAVVALVTYAFREQLFPSVAVRQSPETTQIDTSSDVYKQYAAMTGDEYDRAFIADMIGHHQGAVDMAEMALTNAQHQELKDMARDIISAQAREITQMTKWQQDWGYPSTDSHDMMDHSAMGMMDGMAGMNAALEGKTGDAFDKVFMEQMIVHHQSAIDMAAPGEKNAQHQELKDLTKAVVSEQTKEIQQMQQWQKDWGY